MNARVEALLDRLEIRELLEQYFVGDDRKDRDVLEDCFTADAEAIYDMGAAGIVHLSGRDAIIAAMLGGTADKLHLNHWSSNSRIKIEGDRASADTFAIANVVIGTDRPSLVMVRGLEYLDELRREPAGWRIARREHHGLWQYEVAAAVPQIRPGGEAGGRHQREEVP